MRDITDIQRAKGSTGFSVEKYFNSFIKLGSLLLVPSIWFLMSYLFRVSERYLPTPLTVAYDFTRLSSSLLFNSLISFSRICIGYGLGVFVGLHFGSVLFRYKVLRTLLISNVHALRAVPPTATIPFFILWFGFSEVGKILVIALGISFNISIAVLQILMQMPERYSIAIKGFEIQSSDLPERILLPLAIEQLLPTLRFSLTVAVGLGVVAELLGAQSGLGYLIQSARVTYSLGVVVLCAAIYGIMTTILDASVRSIWRYCVPWKFSGDPE